MVVGVPVLLFVGLAGVLLAEQLPLAAVGALELVAKVNAHRYTKLEPEPAETTTVPVGAVAAPTALTVTLKVIVVP